MLGCVYGDNVLPFLVLRDAGWSEKRGEAIVAGVATFWRQDARRGHLVFRTPFFFVETNGFLEDCRESETFIVQRCLFLVRLLLRRDRDVRRGSVEGLLSPQGKEGHVNECLLFGHSCLAVMFHFQHREHMCSITRLFDTYHRADAEALGSPTWRDSSSFSEFTREKGSQCAQSICIETREWFAHGVGGMESAHRMKSARVRFALEGCFGFPPASDLIEFMSCILHPEEATMVLYGVSDFEERHELGVSKVCLRSFP